MSQQYASQQAPGFKNCIENVAVVGAGGNVGKYIVEELLNTGKHVVTGITRPNSKSEIAPGVIVKKIDYSGDDFSGLVEVLKGQDALIITMGVVAENDPQTKLIRAAIEAKVPWIMTNEFGVDGTNEKLGADTLIGPRTKPYRDMIEQSGVSSWVNPACGFWLEFSLSGGVGRYGFDLKNKTVLFYDDGQKKINTSTWPQVGRAVAALFSFKVLPEDSNDDATHTLSHFRNRYAYVSSFNISQQDMLDSVLRVTKDRPEDWKVTKKPAKEVYEESKKLLFAGDRSAFGPMLYSRVFYADEKDFESTHGLDNDILGLPKEDLDEVTKTALNMDAPWATNSYHTKK